MLSIAPDPYPIAHDTYVVPELFPAGPDAYVPISSMVITGAEPVLVDTGDRTLVATRPPVFDSPTTRGLFDTTTGAYWAADAFAHLVPGPVQDAADIARPMWEETFLQLNRLLSPWHAVVDTARYGHLVDAVASLDADVVASAHGAALRGERLAAAIDLIRQMPDMDVAVEPGQDDLDTMLSPVAS
jgi:hypothetical protein